MTAIEGGRMAARGGGRIRIRWIVLAIIFALSLMAYVQRTGLGVAADRMLPDLGLTNTELGWLQTAFLISYTVFQIPSSILGEVIGARRALPLLGVVAVLATIATATLPAVLTGTALIAGLLAARFVLGISHAPVFPVTAGVIEAWFPVGRWSFPMGLLSSGLNVGSAVAQPLVAEIMEASNWQTALTVSSAPMLLVVAVWWIYGRDRATEHPDVTPEEIAEICSDTASHGRPKVTLRQTLRLLGNWDILMLSLSYMLMNYVFYLLTCWRAAGWRRCPISPRRPRRRSAGSWATSSGPVTARSGASASSPWWRCRSRAPP
jgi:sugar phosphate permease